MPANEIKHTRAVPANEINRERNKSARAPFARVLKSTFLVSAGAARGVFVISQPMRYTPSYGVDNLLLNTYGSNI